MNKNVCAPRLTCLQRKHWAFPMPVSYDVVALEVLLRPGNPAYAAFKPVPEIPQC